MIYAVYVFYDLKLTEHARIAIAQNFSQMNDKKNS